MEKTRYFSYRLNNLAKGCRLCVKGKKSVLFVTGICPESCFYCPISDQKKNKDVVYINEWPTKEWKSIKKEISLCKSTGAGITGGDPLARLSRTINLIKKLKIEFTKNFHIHLYTPLTLVTENTLKKLYEAGLDEIRFHPSLQHPDKESWKKILLSKKFKWKVGVEIPVIPKKESLTKQLIDFLAEIKIHFLNLNELEYSDTNANSMSRLGYKTKDMISYAIKGSEPMAMNLLSYIQKNYPKMNVHYCTAILKDKVQMKNRLKLRAQSIKNSFDILSADSTLIRGTIYLNEFIPGSDYRKKLENIKKERKDALLKKLKELRQVLKQEFNLRNIILDKHKIRLLLPKKDAEFIASEITPKLFKIAVVEEYPTYDEFEAEIDFLS